MQKKISRRHFFGIAGFAIAGLATTGCQEQRAGSFRLSRKYSMPKANYSNSAQAQPKTYTYEGPISEPVQQSRYVSHPQWLPSRNAEQKSKWEAIVIHHTAMDEGSASMIDESHRNIGYDGIGYDFVINNGTGNPDGLVEVGYRWKDQLTGAHCRPSGCTDNYWNEHSIGVVMIGNFEHYSPTSKQYKSLAEVINFLQKRYNIPHSKVYSHYNVPDASTKCPGRHFSKRKLDRTINKIA